MTRRRLDAELVRRGSFPGPQDAREAIEAGTVTVEGSVVRNPASMVRVDAPIVVHEPEDAYASRAGDKLAAALDRFVLDPAGERCLDAGASTGGFTDVLLRRGASAVVAVDVGYGQLAWHLRTDPRVRVLDRTNVRSLDADAIGGPVSFVVADLSFISLRTVLPALVGLARPYATFVVLVKPQFEVGRDATEGGVVRDPDAWRAVLTGVADAAAQLGLIVRGAMASPVPGPAGNVEFLLWLAAGDGPPAALEDALAEGLKVRP